MRFETLGDAKRPAILFFHAMGVTGASSEPVAKNLQARYFCILPTSTVYCAGQKYVSKADEVRQVETFLRKKGVEKLAMVVASSIGADLAAAFLAATRLPVEHVFFDGGQFAQIGRGMRRVMTPFLYLAIKHGFEPLLLVPIAFGMLLVNIYPDIMAEPYVDAAGIEHAGGLLHYFYLMDEWSILPSLILLYTMFLLFSSAFFKNQERKSGVFTPLFSIYLASLASSAFFSSS